MINDECLNLTTLLLLLFIIYLYELLHLMKDSIIVIFSITKLYTSIYAA